MMGMSLSRHLRSASERVEREGQLCGGHALVTPQGGPLSPLRSNVVLDELDQELARSGHRLVHYADDAAYPPAVMKRAIVGSGRADKQQVAQLVGALLGLSQLPSVDATDALAVAVAIAT